MYVTGKREQAAGVVNEGFSQDEPTDTPDGQTTEEDFDGTKTYRSAVCMFVL